MTHDPHSSSLFSLLSPTPSFYAGEAEIYGGVGKGGGSGAGSCRTGAGEARGVGSVVLVRAGADADVCMFACTHDAAAR